MAFVKGKSGNPNGRPALGKAITPFLRSIAEEELIITDKDGNERKITKAEALGRRIWQEALTGDYNFMKLIINYTDGMPIQAVDANLTGVSELTKEETEKLFKGINEKGVDSAI